MTEQKRFYAVLKNGVSGNAKHLSKLKEILISTKHKPQSKTPIIKLSDNLTLLPKYTEILGNSENEEISMADLQKLLQDLDELHGNLERLLCISAKRIRYYVSEIENIDDLLNGRKAHGKNSLKRKRDEKVQSCKDGVKNRLRLVKRHSPPVKYVYEQEIPKVALPKNDNSDKFWSSLEPFCRNVTRDDIAFLESLIQECSKDIAVKIPEVGEPYNKAKSESVINDEHNLEKSLSIKSHSQHSDANKKGLYDIVECPSMAQAQKILAALLEEQVFNSLPRLYESNNKLSKIKSLDIAKLQIEQETDQFFESFKKELFEQGILTTEDLTKTTPDDEILTEIKKCQQELITVNEYNTKALSKLKTFATNNLRCKNIEEELDDFDKGMMDLYNIIIIAKKKTAWREEDFDKNVFITEITKEFDNKATLLSKQLQLYRKNNGLSDMPTLC